MIDDGPGLIADELRSCRMTCDRLRAELAEHKDWVARDAQELDRLRAENERLRKLLKSIEDDPGFCDLSGHIRGNVEDALEGK